MLQNQQEFGDVLWIIYERSAQKFFIRDVKMILAETSKLKNRLENVATQVTSLCRGTLEQITELKVLETSKEQKRVMFDYYRDKMAKLQKTHAQSTDPKKLERFTKNNEKQSEANKVYKKACTELEQHLRKIEGRTDVVLEQLCIKFGKEVEAQFYTEVNLIF